MSLSMKDLQKRQRGRTPMAKENRRAMRLRFSIDEQLMIIDGLEYIRRVLLQTDSDTRKVDVLIERVSEAK